MNWVPVEDKDHYKEWLSEDGQYRITWRDRVYGCPIPPRYHSCVLCQGPTGSQWSFAGRRGPYKTFQAAEKAAKRHRKFWLQSLKPRKRKLPVPLGAAYNNILATPPAWITMRG